MHEDMIFVESTSGETQSSKEATQLTLREAKELIYLKCKTK